MAFWLARLFHLLFTAVLLICVLLDWISKNDRFNQSNVKILFFKRYFTYDILYNIVSCQRGVSIQFKGSLIVKVRLGGSQIGCHPYLPLLKHERSVSVLLNTGSCHCTSSTHESFCSLFLFWNSEGLGRWFIGLSSLLCVLTTDLIKSCVRKL